MGISTLSFLLVIAICVLSHESGHFLAARLFGVQVHEFAFGMGPTITRFVRGTTIWSIRMIPIGGFVRLAGMGEEQTGEEVLPGRSFPGKAPWKRLLILAGGSGSNIFLALIFTAFLLWGHGVLNLENTRIGEIMPGYPAESAGLLKGDAILEISGSAVANWSELSSTIRKRAEEGPVDLKIDRKGEIFFVSVSIPFNQEHNARLLGIRPSMVRYPFIRALFSSTGYIWNFSIEIVKGIFEWATGRGQVDVTGPVGIASMAGKAAKEGFWTFLAFLSMINLHLGILNLLPFPALDGGRILIIMGEIITGRRLPEKWEGVVHLVGFALLILLLIFVTWKDLVHVFCAVPIIK
ncbi:MAG: M50 family metallopeptidase [Thermovirgaceae bacterium]|nr:M50 family metallopeptidase [Thermovirgaceae bacterium]